MTREANGKEQPDGHTSSHEPGARERILDASRDLFTDKGFDAVSIREIAEAAGVNSALIYYYFQDKDGLYRQVLESVFGCLLQRVQEITGRGEGRPSEVVLRELASMYLHFLEGNQGSIKLMYYELARGGPNLPALAGNFLQPAFLTARKVIECGMEEGTFRPLDPSLGVLSLLSMLLFYFIGRPVLEHLIGDCGYSPEGLEVFFNHTMQLYFHGLLETEVGSRRSDAG